MILFMVERNFASGLRAFFCSSFLGGNCGIFMFRFFLFFGFVLNVFLAVDGDKIELAVYQNWKLVGLKCS